MKVVAEVAGLIDAPIYRRFSSAIGEHVLVVPHSRVYDLNPSLAKEWDSDNHEASKWSELFASTALGESELSDVVEPSVQSLSLNVSSDCNLGCSYCYADRGSFGGRQLAKMSNEVAFAGIDALLSQADIRAPITVGFLGGEPLINQKLVRAVVDYATAAAERVGADLRFSITTNGTLVDDEAIELFRNHRFAVTVSVDGDAFTHDKQRPSLGGRGSFSLIAKRVAPLLSNPGKAQVAARMTVGAATPFRLKERIKAVLDLGFSEVGLSPLRVAADGSNFHDGNWADYLDELTAISREQIGNAIETGKISLTNFAVALKQIHRGASSPYPCGAGGGYFSLSAEGKWYACHRAIGEKSFEMGTSGGLNSEHRRAFLIQRHVHSQTDCASCWARYLCSGSCHQEAVTRTLQSCEFIRSWLLFCLAAYCELSVSRPSFFYPSLDGGDSS